MSQQVPNPECKKCHGRGWLHVGNGEDYECECSFYDGPPEPMSQPNASHTGELLPCPCIDCGRAQTTISVPIISATQWRAVECDFCGARGPRALGDDAAVISWNRRAQPAAVRELAEAARELHDHFGGTPPAEAYANDFQYENALRIFKRMTAALAALPECGK